MEEKPQKSLKTPGYTFFYQGELSNFYNAKFTDFKFFPALSELEQFRTSDGGVEFSHVEQFMHAAKAALFKDFITFQKIMTVSTPLEAKRLGRKVTPYDDKVWNSKALDIVTRGCTLKFSQNPDLRLLLLNTGDTLIVECAGRDTKWGIGLGLKNPKIHDPSLWRGENWLGQCLTRAREAIKNERVPFGAAEELERDSGTKEKPSNNSGTKEKPSSNSVAKEELSSNSRAKEELDRNSGAGELTSNCEEAEELGSNSDAPVELASNVGAVEKLSSNSGDRKKRNASDTLDDSSAQEEHDKEAKKQRVQTLTPGKDKLI